MQKTCINAERRAMAGWMRTFFCQWAASLLLLTPALAEEPVRIASLSTVLADFAREIGADRVRVVEIVKPGTDPHLFEPSPGDLKEISGARIVLANGLGFEPYLERLRKSTGGAPLFVVGGDAVRPIMASGDFDHGHDHAHGDDHDQGPVPDPHWWHSISNAKAAARAVRDALVDADPSGQDVYEKNAKTLFTSLDALQKWSKAEVAKLPRSGRILVTSHDALGYFAREFGFKVMPVQGVSTSEQPSSQKVRGIISEIKALGVKAIFAENIENPKVLEEITRETGAKQGGIVYADGLGPGPASTYDGMFRHNVTTIVSGLQ